MLRMSIRKRITQNIAGLRQLADEKSIANQAIFSFSMILTLVIFLIPFPTFATLSITSTTNTAAIQTQLTGQNVVISNVTHNQGAAGTNIGTFTGGTTGGLGPLLGVNDGITLVAGPAIAALGPNNSSSKSTGGVNTADDANLATVDSHNQFDTTTLQFDVVPSGQFLAANFVFGSEEHNEYVCTIFNDAMGIFVSGPGITGTVNIARAENLVPISVNQINRGSAGAASVGAQVAPCTLTNTAFHVKNLPDTLVEQTVTGNFALSAAISGAYTNLQFDGFTVPLSAQLKVQPGQTYHVKVVVADMQDGLWDTGAFIDNVNSYNLDFGDAPASYGPTLVDLSIPIPSGGAARHAVPLTGASIYLGSNGPDAELSNTLAISPNPANGDDTTGTDDEDAVSGDIGVPPGATSFSLKNIRVTNATGTAGLLLGWIDFNKNGSFLDAGEVATATITAGQTSATLNWSGFAVTTVGTTYARFRITTDSAITTTNAGNFLAVDGEIEDHRVLIQADYGDAPDTGAGTGVGNYKTTSSDGGAVHALDTRVFLGTNVPDLDSGTLQNAAADADDTNATDDEDGVASFPSLTTASTSYTVNVRVTNTSGSNATLIGWIDLNKNGLFEVTEGASAAVATGTSGGSIALNWTGLSGLTIGTTYARFRLSTDTALTTNASIGTMSDGEVEDYALTINLPTSGISGTVFEDVNYGGGVGRDLATSNGSPRAGATVELYYTTGTYVSNTTTDASGNYSFTGLTSGNNYFVRVVNSTVTSSRTGYVAGLMPVQTYRTDASTSTAIAIADHVGGENPAVADAPANTTNLVLNLIGYTLGGAQVQSITPVKATNGTVSKVDFGFNFDSIVNTNNGGQGSLRQFITNSNALDNAGLAQVGQAAGKEVSLFMLPRSGGYPGIRTGLTDPFVGGIATIIPTTALTTVTDASTYLDATTQNGATPGTPIIELNGVSAGVSANGLTTTGSNTLIRGFTINRFNGAGILLNTTGSGTGGIVKGNYIGLNSNGTAAQANGTDGIQSGGANAQIGGTAIVDRNIISGNTRDGIQIYNGTATAQILQGNYIGTDSSGTSPVGNGRNGIFIANNNGLHTIGGSATGAGNVIAHNGGEGLLLLSTSPNPIQTLMSRNAIFQNGGVGIDLSSSTVVRDGVTGNDGALTATGANTRIDYPIITSATLSGGTLKVGGYVGNNVTGSATFANATLEFFIADNSDNNQNGPVMAGDGKSVAHGEGRTYIGTCTTDALGLFSTTSCSFSNAGALGLTSATNITATATDAAGNTSEFGAMLLSVTSTITGTVFEDVTFPGGAGRDLATSSGSPRANARVELYDNGGAFVGSTTTDASGNYNFTGLVAGNDYYVRVVNNTVTSSRGIACSNCVPVQTYRTDASTSTATPVTNHVGGEVPSVDDTDANLTSQSLNLVDYTLGGMQAQSVTKVKATNSTVTNVDFGYNFDTIVNTNDRSGSSCAQGSLCQYITNANGLSGANTSLFMISDGAAHPGLRAGLTNQLIGGVAVITVGGTALPISTDSNTSIDGTTQTTLVGDSNASMVGTGGTVGVDGLTLSQVNRPEVQIVAGVRDILYWGLDLTGSSNTVRGLAITGFGLDLVNHSTAFSANIHATGNNVLIEQTLVGTTATSFSAPPADYTLGSGILAENNGGGTIRNNLIGFTDGTGLILRNTSSAFSVTNNELRGNDLHNDGRMDGMALLSGGSGHNISGNLFIDNGACGIDNSRMNNLTITNNTIKGNGVAPNGSSTFQGDVETPGIRLGGAQARIYRNIITANYGAGIMVRPATTPNKNTISQNSIFMNGTITDRAGGLPSGQIGIDLLLGSENTNHGAVGSPPSYISPNDGNLVPGATNDGMDYPIITSAKRIGNNLQVSGYLGDSGPVAAFGNATLEFFVGDGDTIYQDTGAISQSLTNTVPHYEGQSYIGSCPADATGKFSCSFTSAAIGSLPNIARVTATATATDGDTSEFGVLWTSNPANHVSGYVFKDSGGRPGIGVANDGLRRPPGFEAGLGNVQVTLSDCASNTVLAAALTDGAGAYDIAIPGTVIFGTQLCLDEVNPSTPVKYVSTGANFANNAVLGSVPSVPAGNATYNRTADRIQFRYSGNANYGTFYFADVPENQFLTDGVQQALPGATVVYPHTFIAGSDGNVTFSTSATETPPVTGWDEVLFRDNNCDGKLNSGDTQLTATISLITNQKICLLLKQTVSVLAPVGAQSQVTITANFTYTNNGAPVFSTAYMHTDLTTVGNGTNSALKLLKTVDKATAKPGDVLTYTITYSNNSSAPLSTIVLTDATPAYTLYQSAACTGTLPASITACTVTTQPAVNAEGAIKWTLTGSLLSNQQGTVTFSVKVQP